MTNTIPDAIAAAAKTAPYVSPTYEQVMAILEKSPNRIFTVNELAQLYYPNRYKVANKDISNRLRFLAKSYYVTKPGYGQYAFAKKYDTSKPTRVRRKRASKFISTPAEGWRVTVEEISTGISIHRDTNCSIAFAVLVQLEP